MRIIGLILILYVGSTFANDASTSGTKDPSTDAEIIEQIEQILHSFNDAAIIDTLDLIVAHDMVNEGIRAYGSLQNQSSRRSVSGVMFKLWQLKDIIEGSIYGKCKIAELRGRSPTAIIRFKTRHNLYNYIKKLNMEHANYCITQFVIDVSKAIDERIRPNKEMLENIENLRQHYEAKRSMDTSTSSSQSFPDLQNSDAFMVNTVMDYFKNKYDIPLLPDETMAHYKMRFVKQFELFIGNPPDAFCIPIMNSLDQDFFQKFEYLKQLNPTLDARIDKVTHNWLSILRICKRLRFINPTTLFGVYLSLNYDVHQLEQTLRDTNVDTRRYSATETRQNLEILRVLYVRLPVYSEWIEHLDQLLEANDINKRKCVTHNIASLITLYKDHLEQPNLEIYMKEQVVRQLAMCKPILENNIQKTISRIGLFERNKITQFRHIFEKSLDESSPIKEIWQSTGSEKVQLFNQAMIDYVASNIGCQFENLQDLRDKVSAKLAPACRSIHETLMPLNELFQLYVEFDINFRDTTHSWMSSFAICDYYARNSFDWDAIFDHLKGQDGKKTKTTFSNLFGACRRPE